MNSIRQIKLSASLRAEVRSLYLQNFSETSAHEFETTSGSASININVQTFDSVLDQ